MYRKAEIIYCPSQNDALRELLLSYNVRFTDNGNVCKFTLNADAPDSALIIAKAEHLSATILYSWQFTPQEIADAQWYLMESRNGKIESADDEYTFTFGCLKGRDELGTAHYRHKWQKAPYCVRKDVKWNGKHQIYGDNAGGLHTFFCSEHAKGILQENVSGLEFFSVLRTDDRTPMADAYQLRAVQFLPNEALILPSDAYVEVCPQCGEKRFMFSHSGLDYICLKKEYISDDCDIYETEDFFGWGFGYRLVIVSKKMYLLLAEKLKERGLTFTPIKVL